MPNSGDLSIRVNRSVLKNPINLDACFAIAEAEIDLSAAKLLVKEAENTIGAPKKLQLTAAKAKAFSTKVCQKHFPILLHKMGAEGFQNDYPFSKYIAAVQMASLMDGSNEMLLERISRES